MANPAPGWAKKPEHRVDIHLDSTHLRVTFGGTVIADSRATLRIEETGHGPVHYFPETDVKLGLLKKTQHSTYCPFKGDASYWTIEVVDGGEAKRSENAVWGYVTPYDEATKLAGYYAFYASRVDAIEAA